MFNESVATRRMHISMVKPGICVSIESNDQLVAANDIAVKTGEGV
jgi:hypothetical protein